MKAPAQHARGFSTLDALAGVMVLNMLCLGVLAMQLQALQAQRDALAMQAAVGLAQDLWERMQLFPHASMSYQLQLGQMAPNTDCKSQACTPSQWAQSDLSAWQAAVQLRLPGAQTQLVTNASAKVQLLLAWPDNSTQDLGAAVPTACPSRHRCWQTSWSL
jgi:type IV pilus modification protein PilV